MNTTSNFNANRTTESTDRNVALVTGSRSNGTANPKSASTRTGTARRLLNALMRSLATPHI